MNTNICPYCNNNLEYPAKVLGCEIVALMKFHLGLHREDAVQLLMDAVRDLDGEFEGLDSLVDKIAMIDSTIEAIK